MNRRVFALLVVGLLAGGLFADASALTVSLDLRLRQTSASGRCPVSLKGVLRIIADGPCNVEYGILRSDGEKEGPKSVSIDKAGFKDIDLLLTFNGSLQGWVQAFARSSQDKTFLKSSEVSSDRVAVDVTCRSASISAAELPCQTELAGGCCAVQACGSIRVTGNGFGAAQGASRLLIDGSPAASIQSWSNTEIVASAPLQLGEHITSIAVADGPLVITNTLRVQFLMTWYMYGPRACRPGAEATVQIWGGGTSQAGRTLILTNPGAPEYPMEILSWTGTGETGADRASIRFRVPADIPIPQAAYILEVKNGSSVVSKMLSFGVPPAEPRAR